MSAKKTSRKNLLKTKIFSSKPEPDAIKKIAEWAAENFGFASSEVENYVKAVRRADIEEAGDNDVVR